MATRRITRAHALKGTTLAVASLTVIALAPSMAQAEPNLTIEQVEAKIDALGQQAEQASEAYNEAVLAQTEGQQKLAQINDSITAQQARVTELQGAMGGFAAAAYKSGGVDSTLSLVLTEDPDDFLAQAAALDGVARHQSDTVRKISVANQRLSQDKAVAAQQQAQLDAAEDQLKAQKKAVEAKIAEQNRVLAGLKEEQRQQLELRRQREADAAAAAAREAQNRIASSQQSSRSSSSGASESFVANVPASGRAATAVAAALSKVGKPYRWGASGPNAFDCSGLTMWAYRQAGVSLPHSSRAQYNVGTHVSRSQLQPGDLIFYYSPISHVGMYVGGGRMVHASTTGKPVAVVSVDWGRYVGATRP